MNRSAQNKVFIILGIIFVLFISSLGYWYFFVYKCGILPQGYEFLDRFVVKNVCKEKKYKVKGIIYNIRGEDSNILFDFNAWDTQSRESLYYENIEVNKEIFTGEFQVIPENFGAVELDIKFKKDIQQILTFKSYGLESVNVEELKLTEEKYNEVFNTIYTAITRSPLVEDTDIQVIPNDYLNAVFTKVKYIDNKYYPYLTNSFTNSQLYRPWLLSYIYKDEWNGIPKVEKQKIINMLSFDVDEFFEKAMLENPAIGCPASAICEDVSSNPEGIGAYSYEEYQFSNSFACLMIWQISENLTLEDNEIITKYCDLDYFESSMNSMYSEMEKYKINPFNNYIDLLDLDILQKNPEDVDVFFHSSNIASLLADTYGAKRLYNEDINSSLEDNINYVLDYMSLYGVPYLKNICSISYFSDLLMNDVEFNNNPDITLISQRTREVFIPISKKMLELMDDDQYGSLLCLEGFSDEETIKEIKKVEILKIMYLYTYSDSERLGIWINNEYDIRINARFLKLYNSNKGNLQ